MTCLTSEPEEAALSHFSFLPQLRATLARGEMQCRSGELALAAGLLGAAPSVCFSCITLGKVARGLILLCQQGKDTSRLELCWRLTGLKCAVFSVVPGTKRISGNTEYMLPRRRRRLSADYLGTTPSLMIVSSTNFKQLKTKTKHFKQDCSKAQTQPG